MPNFIKKKTHAGDGIVEHLFSGQLEDGWIKERDKKLL